MVGTFILNNLFNLNGSYLSLELKKTTTIAVIIV